MIDAAGILYLTEKHRDDLICGGRSQRNYELFDNFFSDLTSFGAKVVVFADLNVQEEKSRQWLDRRNQEYQESCDTLDSIARGRKVMDIVRMQSRSKALTSARHAIYEQAKKHGELYFAIKHDCDAELAKYARDNKALAMIGNDSDFLIFEGDWEYWSASDMNIDNYTTLAYNRRVLIDNLRLTYKQMPVFATLMSNDHTKFMNDQLRDFHSSLGKMFQKWQNMAVYVRNLNKSSFDLNEDDIAKISKRVFGAWDSMEAREMITNGIQSYNLDFVVHRETDPVLQKVVGRPDLYKMLTSPILTLTVTMYDMRVKIAGKSYTDVAAELTQKCVGVLFQERDPKYTFTLFGIWNHAEKWCSKKLKPIFPPETCEWLMK